MYFMYTAALKGEPREKQGKGKDNYGTSLWGAAQPCIVMAQATSAVT